ncbi:MAG TPA: AAA family ATPase [Acidimicrobiales bacterium]|nr:AAA family ATPase [Acidimicrobiales bacterium]
MAVGVNRDAMGGAAARPQAKLLGPFSLSLGDLNAGPWVRPSARRVVELVLISPGRRIFREAAAEALFPQLGATEASNALRKALSLARSALSALGEEDDGLLWAARDRIWASPDIAVDYEAHQGSLRAALALRPGPQRDEALSAALAEERTLMEDEPFVDWAMRPREALEALRQDARLCLARDRAQGYGHSAPDAVVEAWEACFCHDRTCEEAATALVRAYALQGRHSSAAETYQHCREALEDLGLRASAALEEVYVSYAPKASSAAGARVRHQRDELRLVSVLLVEVAGPGTGHRLGPEDLRELVGGTLAEVIAQVEALGGTVTSVSGSGLAALFGAPESHEDDPERALRAAFRIVGGTEVANGALSLRAGVETGRAVVGPIVGASAGHYGAVGEVVGSAAAQRAARPGSVLVGPATRGATETLFEWGPTEEVAVAPGSRPVSASYLGWPRARPLGPAGRPRRFAGGGPLVGREAELSLLCKALREATSGQGSVVTIVGEPGLGKTRLVNECRKLFMAWVGAASGRLPLWLEGRAASYASSAPYGLYQQLLAAWLGIAPEDGENVVSQALQRALKVLSLGQAGDEDHLGLLTQMMGLQGQKRASAAELSPEARQRATFAAVRAVLAALVARGPTVLVLEDLHWADPTSLKLTHELCPLSTEGPLLVLMTRRPEPDPGASDLESSTPAGIVVHKLVLSPLPPQAEQELAQALIGEKVPEDIVASVSQNAGGNPLFLEERISSLLETGVLAKDDAGWHLGESFAGQVPEVLERLVRSRVDRLAPVARDVVLSASVLGAQFGVGAVGAVADVGTGLPDVVSGLCEGGLLAEVPGTSEPTYRFRHALIQDAAYKSLMKDQRRRLHAKAAWALEEAASDRLEEVAAVLGHHYALAGDTQRAAHFLALAVDHAADAFANEEAITSARRALELLASGDGALSARAAAMWEKLGGLLWRVGRYEEARAAYLEGASAAVPDERLLAARCYAAIGFLGVQGLQHHDEALGALDAAEELLDEATEKDSDEWVDAWLSAQCGRVELYYWGDTKQAEAVLARERPIVEARGTPAQRARFYIHVGHVRARISRYRVDESIVSDFRAGKAAAHELEEFPTIVGAHVAHSVFARGYSLTSCWASWQLGFALWWNGDIDAALVEFDEALRAAGRTGDRLLEVLTRTFMTLAYFRQGNVRAVKEMAALLGDLASAMALPENVGVATGAMAWVAWKEGRLDEVETLAQQALESWESSVRRYPVDWVCLLPLISVQLCAERYEEAIAAARRLLTPSQMRLPDELEAAVETAIADWGAGQADLAARRLEKALKLAEELNFA